jgi:putative heme-binding domain-containing protein
MRLSRVMGTAALAVLGLFGLGMSGTQAAQGPGQQYSADNIRAGYRLYLAQCALCHANNGDGIQGVNLARGQFKRVVSDADIRNTVANGVAAAGMPSFSFQPAEFDAIIAYIRSGFDLTGVPFAVGDAGRGKVVYDGKGGCAACHRVKGEGSRSGPDLSDIGVTRKPAGIQLSLLQPTAGMLAINRPVKIVTRDGRTITGRRLNEDTQTVQLMTNDEKLVSLVKADIRDYDIGTGSGMPSYSGRLTDSETADLLAYLLSLKG